MMDEKTSAVLWLVEFLPIAFLAVLAGDEEGEYDRELWALGAVFLVSFLADGAAYMLREMGEPTWIVPVLYPVLQVGVLAYGFSARWPKLARAGTLFSVSITAAAAGVAIIKAVFDGIPVVPEMRVLAVASAIALWFTYVRSDLPNPFRWTMYLAFGATLPAVFAMRPLFDRGLHLWWELGFKVPFTLGVAVAIWAIWRGHRQPKTDTERPPPQALQVLRSLMLTATGRA